MRRLLLTLFFCLSFCIFSFAQKAQKIDEFGFLPCDDLLSRADNFAQNLEENPNSKLYIIFYEGKYPTLFYNKTKKKLEWVLVNPRRGEARNKTKAITLYLTKYRKVSPDKFELIDGGFDKNYRVQIWLTPNGSAFPELLPTLKKTNIRFRKGKASKVADCQGYYNSI